MCLFAIPIIFFGEVIVYSPDSMAWKLFQNSKLRQLQGSSFLFTHLCRIPVLCHHMSIVWKTVVLCILFVFWMFQGGG